MRRLAPIAILLLAFASTGCAALSALLGNAAPPPEDTRAMRELGTNLKAALKTQEEVRREDMKRWADRMIEVALGEIHQATLDDLKAAQIAGTLTSEKIAEIENRAQEQRKTAVAGIQARFARSVNLRIDAEVREMVEWMNTYLLARLGTDEANRELLTRVKDLAAEVGIDKYLPPLPGEQPRPGDGP